MFEATSFLANTSYSIPNLNAKPFEFFMDNILRWVRKINFHYKNKF